MALFLTHGQRADIKEAEPLLDEVDPKTLIAAVQLVSTIIGIN
ncbi:hypothetical protein [Acetobacter aceti]|nr:hypothetical protein [Acetobacter aceti]